MPRRIALWSVVLLGAALRLFPIWFGLPYSHARPDETTALARAIGFLAGDPNPHFFNWPSLALYLFAGLFHAAGLVAGSLARADYFLIARAAVALAGTATIPVVARLTTRIADRQAGIIAALFLAVSVLHVRDSHFATTDILMTLLVTGALVLLVDAGEASSARGFLLAGLVAGLAISTKYSAAPVLAAVFFVPAWGARRWRAVAIFLGAAVAGFVAGTPYAMLDFSTLRADMLFEQTHLTTGHAAADLGPGWLYHLRRSLPYGLGMTLFAAALAGIVPVWIRRRRVALPVFAFAVAFFVAIGSARTVFFRYILPLVPLACASAAVFVCWLTDRIATRIGAPRAVVSALLIALIAGPSLVTAVRLDLLLARTDSRVEAASWLRPRLRPDQTVYDAGNAYTKLELGDAAFHEWRYDAGSGGFINAGGRVPDWIILYDSPLPSYATIDQSLRVLTTSRYSLVQHVAGTAGRGWHVFDPQDAFFLPIAGFGGVERPGPDVYIFSVRGER